MNFIASDDQGCDYEFEAENWDEAEEEASEWARAQEGTRRTESGAPLAPSNTRSR